MSTEEGALSSEESKQRILAGAKEDAKQIFESERDAVLSELPDSLKNLFGQVGFARFGKTVYAVLILSPYDVPPGPVRDDWLSVFHKLKSQGRLDSMNCICYWYGTTNANAYYGFIGQKEFVPYDKGSKGAHINTFAAAQRKKESGKTLTKQEKERMKAMEEIQEDLEKEPHERKRGVLDFQEGYEMLSMHDLDDIQEEAGAGGASDNIYDDDDDETLEDEESPPPKKRKRGRPSKAQMKERESLGDDQLDDSSGEARPQKKKKNKRGRKPKKQKVEDEELVDSDLLDDDPAVAPGKKKKKKKKKAARPPKKQKNEEGLDSDMMEEVPPDGDLPPLQKKKKGRKADKHKRTKKPTKKGSEDNGDLGDDNIGASSPGVVGDIEEFGDADADEESVDDKKKDEDFDDQQDVSEPDGADDEEDWDEGAPAAKRQYKSSTKVAGKQTGKGRPVKRKQEVKHKIEVPQKVRSKKKETMDFRRCEEEYLPLITTYECALKAKDVGKLETSVDRVTEIITSVSVPFMQAYLVNLVKQTKLFLKSQESLPGIENLLKKHKHLKKTMNDIYITQNQYVPKDWKPPEKRPQAQSAPVPAAAASDIQPEEPSSPQKRKQTLLSDVVKTESTFSGARKSPDGSQKSSAPKRDSASSHIPRKDGAVKHIKREEAPAKPPPKPERKAFSLGNLGRLLEQSQDSSKKSGASATQPKKLPTWLTGPVTDAVPSGDPRSLALEFLKDMASHFPPGKIDIDATALSLEAALHEYAMKHDNSKRTSRAYLESSKPEQEKWEDVYWERLHEVVASVCGRRDPGTLMQLILNGEFATPQKVVFLDDQKLRKSFEGQAIF